MGDDHTKMKGGKSQAPTVHIKKFFAQAKKQVAAAKAGGKKPTKSSRLYVKGIVAGFRRALTKQKTNTSLIKIQGVEDTSDTTFYHGKKVMYMYRTKTMQGETALASVSCGVRCAVL